MADEELKGSGQYERATETLTSKQAFVKAWLEAIDLAGEEEKDWRKDAEEANQVYVSDEANLTGSAYNIYHANIETICPALYNSTPLPDIRRRYNDRDPEAKAVADVMGRCLSYSIDQYDFDSLMTATVQDLAVTGRGVARVKYEVEMAETAMTDPTTGQPVEDVGTQTVRCQIVPWAAFRRGPGRSWEEVPWVAFAHYMPRGELEKLSPAYGKKVSLTTHISNKGSSGEGAEADKPEASIFRRALVWEIWDREAKKVRFIAPGFMDDELATVDDPLGLKGFYPMPRPIMTGHASGTLVPLTPYRVQKPLLDEIDVLSKRITRLVKQLRPRALGAGSVDLDALSNADDGEIVEVANAMAFMDGGGMDKMLSWFPMEPTIKAIEQLYIQREQAKQALFEVSGLADIMRGASNPSETLGAQQLKQQWGSLRVQKGQAEIQRFVRDIFRLKAELIAEKFTPQNIAAMSGIQMQAQEIQLLKDQKMRDYRVDIETDSTIRGDLTRNMESMTQFVQGTAQYFQAIAPIVQTGGMSKVAAITVYSAFARNFKLGKEVDAVLDQLADEARQAEQQPQEPPPDPAMEKVKADATAKQAELQMMGQAKQAEMQFAVESKQADLALTKEDNAAQLELAAQKHRDEVALKQMEIQTNAELELARIAADERKCAADREVQKQKDAADAQFASEQADKDREHKGDVETIKAGGVAGTIKNDRGQMKAIVEESKATREAMLKMMAEMTRAMTAPKTIDLIKDRSGRITGGVTRPALN